MTTGISLALQDLAPRSCTLVDAHGKEVPLSSAGYVLRFGQAYRLQVIPPFPDADLEEVRILPPPDFVAVQPEVKLLDGQGRSVRTFAFRVQSDSSLYWKRFIPEVRAGELSIAYKFRPAVDRTVPPHDCPIIVRRGWLMVIVAAVFFVAGLIVQAMVEDLVKREPTGQAAYQGFIVRALRDWNVMGLLFGVVFFVLLVGACVTMWLTYQRSRELRRLFRERYPAEIEN
jgi:hypothetical protein